MGRKKVSWVRSNLSGSCGVVLVLLARNRKGLGYENGGVKNER